MLLIDTAGSELLESVDQADSKYNEGEAMVVMKLLHELMELRIAASVIGIIAPYNA